LQGRYLGILRSLKGEARALVKAVAKDKGVGPADRLGNSLR